MVNKGVIGAIAGGVAVLIAAVVAFAPGLFAGLGQMQSPTMGPSGTPPAEAQEVILSLTSVNIKQIDEENATIEIVFDAFNPNKNTLVLEAIEYDLMADGIKLKESTIGERLMGMLTGTGQTYYLVSNTPLTLKDTVQLKKIEPFAEIWSNLQNNDVDWRITGLFIVTDPVRAGGQEKSFDFTL